MTERQELLSLDRLAALVEHDEIETVLVVFTDLYGRFMGKRVDGEFFLEQTATKGTHCCDYLLTVDMEMTPIPGYTLASWELGYGDFHMVPDLSTLRVATWLDRTALVLCDLAHESSERPVAEAPRSVLRAQIQAADAAAFRAFAASELEYYIFEDTYRAAHDLGYDGLRPAGWYIEDYHTFQGTRLERLNAPARRHLKRSGIPVENSKGGWGLGQHELNIRYAEALDMADRHAIFKQCLKEVAEGVEMSVTFMAKYADDQAGSSCHVHLSLWNNRENAFVGDGSLGPVRCSDVFRWFLGGWIAHTPDVMVFYAPTVNSYSRYRAASWAPTRLAWSHDNRTAGFRIVGHDEGLRIECRLPGADCNPHLVYAAALASGLDGIANHIEPPPHLEGNIYQAADVAAVPGTLDEATDLFERSVFARAAFGDAVVDHYTKFFRTESAAYDASTPQWERRRYFERI